MVISFDGPSATGKSTIAKIVAEKLGFKYLNSGMIYRALCYYLYINNVFPEDNNLENILHNLQVKIIFDTQQKVFINGKDYTPFVSDIIVQNNVSIYSQILSVREKVTLIQRDFAFGNNIVVEGRDVGTCVFPDAEYKFFVTCEMNVRAKRRLKDLKNLGQNVSLEDVILSLSKRDELDSTRSICPLKRASDAIDVDTTNYNIDQCVEMVLNYIKF